MRGTKPLPNSLCKRSASAGLRTEPNTRNPFETSTFVVPQPIPVETPVTTTSLVFAIASLLGRDPGHFAKTINSEMLSLPFFDSLQNEAGDEFGLVALGVIGRRSAAGRIPHPVVDEVCCRDERVDFTHHDAVLFQLRACREAESKQRTLRSRVHAVSRNSHEGSSRIDVHDASPALRPHERNHSLHRDNRPQYVEVEDFVKQRGIAFLYGGRIAAPRIVYEAIDAAVMLVLSAYGFPHSIKLRHVYGDGQTAWKLLRQFLQRIATASEHGDFRAALGQRNSRRQPYPRRSSRDNENAIFDLHRSILLFQFDQYPSINVLLSRASRMRQRSRFRDSAFVRGR